MSYVESLFDIRCRLDELWHSVVVEHDSSNLARERSGLAKELLGDLHYIPELDSVPGYGIWASAKLYSNGLSYIGFKDYDTPIGSAIHIDISVDALYHLMVLERMYYCTLMYGTAVSLRKVLVSDNMWDTAITNIVKDLYPHYDLYRDEVYSIDISDQYTSLSRDHCSGEITTRREQLNKVWVLISNGGYEEIADPSVCRYITNNAESIAIEGHSLITMLNSKHMSDKSYIDVCDAVGLNIPEWMRYMFKLIDQVKDMPVKSTQEQSIVGLIMLSSAELFYDMSYVNSIIGRLKKLLKDVHYRNDCQRIAESVIAVLKFLCRNGDTEPEQPVDSNGVDVSKIREMLPPSVQSLSDAEILEMYEKMTSLGLSL
jgi:hypothetical protein